MRVRASASAGSRAREGTRRASPPMPPPRFGRCGSERVASASVAAFMVWSVFVVPSAAGLDLNLSLGEVKLPVPESMSVRALQAAEDGRQRVAAEDARAKDSDLVTELLRRSEANREKNRVAIRDKYMGRELDGTYGGPFVTPSTYTAPPVREAEGAGDAIQADAPAAGEATAAEAAAAASAAPGDDTSTESTSGDADVAAGEPSSMDLLLMGYIED